MALQWLSADLRTGQVLNYLHGLECDYPLRRTIGAYDTATARFYLDDAPPDWEYSIREGGAVLAAYDDNDPNESIQWAGIVLSQTRDTSVDNVQLSLATAESYFDRRFVGDEQFDGVGQNIIVATLIDGYIVDGAGGLAGIPLALQYDGDGTPRDRTYADADAATVYTRLTQLMAVQGGPEFTVEWEFAGGGELLVPTLYIADRIGTAKPADRDPDALFTMPGCITQAVQVRDYSDGKGANSVTAYSSGQGDATPTSGRINFPDKLGRPTFEFRWQPSSSISNVATLEEYAVQALSILAPGARSMTLTAARETAPMLGVDWRLGDDIGYELGGLDEDGRDLVPVFPGGLSGYGRVIAYEVDETTISPILAEAEVYQEDDAA